MAAVLQQDAVSAVLLGPAALCSTWPEAMSRLLRKLWQVMASALGAADKVYKVRAARVLLLAGYTRVIVKGAVALTAGLQQEDPEI